MFKLYRSSGNIHIRKELEEGIDCAKNKKKNVPSAFYHDSIRLANRSSNSWKNLEMASKSVR